MPNFIRAPKPGNAITAKFLNELAAKSGLDSLSDVEGAFTNVGAVRTRALFPFKTVRVLTTFTLPVDTVYSSGTAKEILFSLDAQGNIVTTEDLTNAETYDVIDVNRTLHVAGDILNVYFNASIGKYQTFNAKEFVPQSQLQDKAVNCGCSDFLPPEYLTISYGDYGPYSSVYYYYGTIPTWYSVDYGVYNRIRLEHVSSNVWESAQIDLYRSSTDPNAGFIPGILQMTVEDVVVYTDGAYNTITQPMAFVTFIPAVDLYTYYGLDLPQEVSFRTLKPFNGALNGNKLVYMPPQHSNAAAMQHACDACLAASRDLLPCDECNNSTRAFVEVTTPQTNECSYYSQIAAAEYILYSELNSFFDGVSGWPLTGQVCAFESAELFAIGSITYKIVLLRFETTYEYSGTQAVWKIGLIGYDLDAMSPVIDIMTLEPLADTDCNLQNSTGLLKVYDPGSSLQSQCNQEIVVNYLDDGAA